MIILRKTASESISHILLKLIAYLLFFGDNLCIETEAHQHYKPDLVQFDPEKTWKVAKWVDCGTIDVRKLLKVGVHNKTADIIVLKSSEEGTRVLKEKVDKKLKQASHIRYLIFKKEELNKLELLLKNRNEIAILNESASKLILQLNGEGTLITYISL